MIKSVQTEKPREIAAIDLGSNSFHMVVARVVENGVQIVSRHKQRVRLAAGLDDKVTLTDEAIDRAVECLAMFGERLEGFDPENVRIAATHTLREARNAKKLLEKAFEVLPYHIEVIPGQEEARLIYMGVSHTQPDPGKKLVVDIGGGSTELVIGEQFEPKLLASKRMGCVSYNERFFPNGKLSAKAFYQAQLAAELKLENIAARYQKESWDLAIGSSGTIKAIREVLINSGHEDGVITPKRLKNLSEELLKFKRFEDISLPGLPPERQPVFAAGLAILCGVFDALQIAQMEFSQGALREGLLYEVEERFQEGDIRIRTAKDLALRYRVDVDHATNVEQTASMLYQKAEPSQGNKKGELANLLQWGALLHEVGLSIAYSGFHRHSSYILQNTPMPGFSSEQRLLVATLARFHRKALKLAEMPSFTLFKNRHIHTLIAALRIACILNVQRRNVEMPKIGVTAEETRWTVTFPEEWLEQNRLLAADLEQEQVYWKNAGWNLDIQAV